MAKKQEIKKVAIIVTKRFRDKNDHKTYYEVGQKLEFDEARANDVIERELAELYDPGDEGNENTNSDEQNNQQQ